MTQYTVAIGSSSFATADKYPRQLLEQAGVTVKDNPFGRKMTEEEIIQHLQGVDGLLAGLEPLNQRVFENSKQLKAVARIGIGMDNVDQAAANRLGIKVSNTPDGPTDAVAELCLSALLAIGRNITAFNSDMHNAVWKKRMGFGIQNLKVLIVGFGRIGRRFAELLRFLGAELLIYDCAPVEIDRELGRKVSLEQGIIEADVISLHVSGKDIVIGPRQFEQMKSGMVLLNSARGEIVDENALVNALDSGTVSAAWLDVFSKEPYQGPLCNYDNVLLTPHVSTYTKQCRRNMEEKAVRNLLADLGIPVPPHH